MKVDIKTVEQDSHQDLACNTYIGQIGKYVNYGGINGDITIIISTCHVATIVMIPLNSCHR